MLTLTLFVASQGGAEQLPHAVMLTLHPGYGSDGAVAHEIVGVTIRAGDDDFVRLWDNEGEMLVFLRCLVIGWATRAMRRQ
jgi:hypothetical protein